MTGCLRRFLNVSFYPFDDVNDENDAAFAMQLLDSNCRPSMLPENKSQIIRFCPILVNFDCRKLFHKYQQLVIERPPPPLMALFIITSSSTTSSTSGKVQQFKGTLLLFDPVWIIWPLVKAWVISNNTIATTTTNNNYSYSYHFN